MKKIIYYLFVITIFTPEFSQPGFNCLIYGKENLQKEIKRLQSDDLEIEISCDKTEFIQGESIDILAKIKNNTSKTLTTSAFKHNLYDSSKHSIFTNNNDKAKVDIPPYSTYYYLVDPQDWVLFSGKDFSTNTFYPGNYEYSFSWFVGKNEFTSNKINIKIISVPDSLKEAFEELKFDSANPHSVNDWETLFEKYKGTFYEQQFYYRLLNHPIYYDAVMNKTKDNVFSAKVLKLYKEFILKYCNTVNAYSKFLWLMYNYSDNAMLIDEILTSLIIHQPDCKILEVLRNQPDYMNKEIKYLLK